MCFGSLSSGEQACYLQRTIFLKKLLLFGERICHVE